MNVNHINHECQLCQSGILIITVKHETERILKKKQDNMCKITDSDTHPTVLQVPL